MISEDPQLIAQPEKTPSGLHAELPFLWIAILQNKGKVNAGFLLFSIALLATFVTIALVMMGIL